MQSSVRGRHDLGAAAAERLRPVASARKQRPRNAISTFFTLTLYGSHTTRQSSMVEMLPVEDGAADRRSAVAMVERANVCADGSKTHRPGAIALRS